MFKSGYTPRGSKRHITTDGQTSLCGKVLKDTYSLCYSTCNKCTKVVREDPQLSIEYHKQK
ncbi:hypothetical protein LCGC14_2074380 [marine sediment metagenome]|uniref:Uncharacterized protein n=1 Tax=marine sediment metagenome TaxID=412755 RepID=A0A0F9HEH3_9ZZZZ